MWYWERVYHLLYDTNCLGVGVCVYSLISSPFPYMCVCVSQIKKREYKIFCRVFGEKHWCTQVYSISFELFHLMGLLYCFVGLKKSVFWEENSWFTSIQALAQPCTLLFKAFNDCWGILWAGFGEKNNIILEHYAVILRPLDMLPSKILWSFFFFFNFI